MCVKFEYLNDEIKDFNLDSPIVDQVKNLKAINIEYRDTTDKQEVQSLIEKMTEFLTFNVMNPFDLNFNCNNVLSGARLATQLKKMEKSNKKAFIVSKTVDMNANLVKGLDTILKSIKGE
jgi:hypothetical protein